jgi:hypothetical protein
MSRWERARVKSYGVTDFIKGEEYDIEVLNGIQVFIVLNLHVIDHLLSYISVGSPLPALLASGCVAEGTAQKIQRHVFSF